MSVKFTFKESNQTSQPKEQSNSSSSSSDENQNHQSDANSITQENFQLNDQESESVDGGGGGTAAAEQTNQNIPIADPLERSSVGSNEARDEVGLDTKRSLQITLSVSPYARQFGVFVRPYVML